MLIDVHAHLDFPQFDADRDEVIRRAKGEGVIIVNSGLGRTGIKKTLEIIEKHDNVFATLGLSPREFGEDEIEGTIKLIRENNGRIVGIGEVGLDYYWEKDAGNRRLEAENFARFIELSEELRLPLVIHSRGAEEETVRMVDSAGIKALLHCFGGTAEQAEDAAERGHLVSVPVNVVNSKQKQVLAKALPLESLVLETDAPYLAPVPKSRNEPANIKMSAEKIAHIKGMDTDTVANVTTQNARKFFGLK